MAEHYEGESFVINPTILFPNDDPDTWAGVVSNKGMMKLKPVCHYGESGIQVNIAMANPPSDDMEDAWEASKGPGEWDFWEMLGLIRLPSAEYKLQLFFKEGTFFDRDSEEIFTHSIGAPDVMLGYEGSLEKEWDHIYNNIFVNMYGAESTAGHVWPAE
jgi:hypothetical protein